MSLQRYAVRFGLVPSFSTEKKERKSRWWKKTSSGKPDGFAFRLDTHTHTRQAHSERVLPDRERIRGSTRAAAAPQPGPGRVLADRARDLRCDDRRASYLVRPAVPDPSMLSATNEAIKTLQIIACPLVQVQL